MQPLLARMTGGLPTPTSNFAPPLRISLKLAVIFELFTNFWTMIKVNYIHENWTSVPHFDIDRNIINLECYQLSYNKICTLLSPNHEKCVFVSK